MIHMVRLTADNRHGASNNSLFNTHASSPWVTDTVPYNVTCCGGVGVCAILAPVDYEFFIISFYMSIYLPVYRGELARKGLSISGNRWRPGSP
jgi:hypothetical protein